MASPTIRPGHGTPGGDPMTYYEPQGRCAHWTALINGKLYTYGGYYPGVPREPPSVVELFDVVTELWEQSTTSGPPPPGFIDAACVVMGENCYHFGGHNRVGNFNTMHKLDSRTLTWKELKPMNPRAAPMCKSGTCMVSFDERYLVTFAGYGPLPEHHHRGAEYVPDPKFGDRYGWTNELLVFDTSSRRWSSPETTGSPPPPCYGATFTRVDHHRAVLYGCGQLYKLLPNHIHILDMQSWMWMKIAAGGGPGQPWPVARSYHSAVSLHDPDDPDDGVSDPALMVWWGQVGGKARRDVWVFRVNTLQWREISLPDALRGRLFHTTTIVHCDSTLWKVINIGGVYENPPGATADTLVPVSETVIVELRSSGPSGDLVVTDVKFKGRRTPSLGQLWRASGFPLGQLTPVGAEGLQATHPYPLSFTYPTYPALFIQRPLRPTPLQPFPQMLPSPGVWSSLSQTSSVGVQQPLPSSESALRPELRELVLVRTTNWYDLGLQLHLSVDELDCIEQTNRGDVKICRRLMFREWLRRPNITYKQLVEALVIIGEETEAERLRKKFGLTPATE